ncbi:hypothetical protein U3516DRAFT_648737 [Neocallimastix sp. 'constans']|jgi:hypothetical protein
MKFLKILLVCSAFVTFSLADETKSEENTNENVNFKEEAEKAFKEPKIDTGNRTKEQCEQGYQLLQSVYSDIEKDPKCTYSKEYADENGYKGDYTMDLKNRDYFCSSCLTKYLRLGSPMVKACGSNAPKEMIYDMYFLSSVNSILCAKDKLHDKYCEVVMDELFEKEERKPVVNWTEDSLCGECPYYYHDIFKEREEFYKSLRKDSAETSFLGRILPLRDIDIDCYKEFDARKQEAMKESNKNANASAENSKNINYNEILKEVQKEENEKREQEAQENKEKKEKVEEVDDTKEDNAEKEKEEKVEEKTEEKAEEKTEKPKKASEAGEL